MAAEDLDRGPLREDRRWQSNYSSGLSGRRSAASASCAGKTQTGFQLREEAVGLQHTHTHLCSHVWLLVPPLRSTNEVGVVTITKSPEAKTQVHLVISGFSHVSNSSLVF